MISELRNVIDKTQGEIKSSGLPEIYRNPKYIHLLFHHLISNTLKFCKNDTPPRISINSQRTVDHQWQISVKDNGIGIEKTFKPFEKLNPKDGHNGTGMGLTICRKIAEDHSGTIIAQSNPEGKTVFILTLPKKTGPVTQVTQQTKSIQFIFFLLCHSITSLCFQYTRKQDVIFFVNMYMQVHFKFLHFFQHQSVRRATISRHFIIVRKFTNVI